MNCSLTLFAQTPLHFSSMDISSYKENVFIGQQNVKLFQINIMMSGDKDSLLTGKFYFTLKETSIRENISKIKLFYTQNSNFSNKPFNSLDSVISISSIPISKFSLETKVRLHKGNNYFYLTFDISELANTDTYVGATFDSVFVGDSMRYSVASSSKRQLKEFTDYCPINVIFKNKINFNFIGLTSVKLSSNNPNISEDLDTLTFYSNEKLPVYRLQHIPVTISCGQGYPEQVSAWIDWDNDGIFSEREKVFSLDTILSSTFLTAEIVVPCDASIGTHRLRIMSDYLYAPKIQVCKNLYYGDAEEYLVQVIPDISPIATFKPQPPYYIGTPIEIKNTSTSSGKVRYEWQYDDNGIYYDTSFSPTLTYYSIGWKKIILRMTTKTCDSVKISYFRDSFYIMKPPQTPVSDFLASKNTVTKNEVISLVDISSFGPNQWDWEISPTTREGKILYKWIYNTDAGSRNPKIKFLDTGVFALSLTTENSKGKGTTNTKLHYIKVIDMATMCGNTDTLRTREGVLFDDGGAEMHYSANKDCYVVIKPPCAKAIHITFNNFDASIYNTSFNGRGGDYLKIYDGDDNNGKPLHDSVGFGYGLQNNYPDNSKIKIPEIVARSGSVFLGWHSDQLFNGEGFEMQWFSEIEKNDLPEADFENPVDIYLNQHVKFVSISKGDNLNLFWDFNGDGLTDATGSDVEYNFNAAESYIIRLIASNCAGSDTIFKTISVKFPISAPIVNFGASDIRIATNDLVYLKDFSSPGPYKWEWSISRIDGAKGFKYFKSNENSQNPTIFFTDTGKYNISLGATNDLGTGYGSRPRYITVFSYCEPEVKNPIADLNISRIVLSNASNIPIVSYSFNSKSGYLHPQISIIPYLAENGIFYLRVSRPSNFNKQNAKVWIDLNGDGDFADAGEEIVNLKDIKDSFWEAKIRIPNFINDGISRLRIGTDHNLYDLDPCSISEAGVYRDFTVLLGRDNIIPEITLKGKDTVLLEEQAFYVEPGYKASDDIDGDLSKSVIVKSAVNAFVPGVYIITYNVDDHSGNVANTKIRWVKVIQDTSKPILILKGLKTVYNEVYQPIIEPGVFIADNISSGLVLKDSGMIDSTQTGTYIKYYIAIDARGNRTIINRTYIIGDTTKPELLLIGSNISNIQVYHSFFDPGVVAIDNYSKILKVLQSGYVDTSRVGFYKITYSVTDSFGNGPVDISRFVIVFDSISPVLKMSTDTIFWDVNKPFVYPEYELSDNYWRGVYLKLHEVGFVNVYKAGVYKTMFYATDGSNNYSKYFIVYVKVEDRVPPFIYLLGNPSVHVNRWANFVDPGVQYGDNYDNNPFYHEDGNFKGTLLPGLFFKLYWVQDHSGNKSEYLYRYIYVDDVTTIEIPNTIPQLKIFPNPSSDYINVRLPYGYSKGDIHIEDITGRTIFTLGINQSRELIKIPLFNYSDGIYFIRFNDGNDSFQEKFIIAR